MSDFMSDILTYLATSDKDSPVGAEQSDDANRRFRCEESAMSMIPFDDRDGFIWYDGRLIPWRDAKLHVLSHGLHYASCVF